MAISTKSVILWRISNYASLDGSGDLLVSGRNIRRVIPSYIALRIRRDRCLKLWSTWKSTWRIVLNVFRC